LIRKLGCRFSKIYNHIIMRYLLGMFLLQGLWTTVALAQSDLTRPNQPDPHMFRLNSKSDGIKGTPYLFENFQPAKISLVGGKVYDEIPFNILLEKGEVYIQSLDGEGNGIVLKNWEWIETTEEDPRLFRIEYVEGRPNFVEIIFENEKQKLIARHSKPLIRPSGQRDGYSGPQYDEFRHDIHYFWLNGLQSEEIKMNTQGLKTLAGDRLTDVRQFIKTNKLKPEQPQDLKKIMKYLNP
jgi:hypothetical protein